MRFKNSNWWRGNNSERDCRDYYIQVVISVQIKWACAKCKAMRRNDGVFPPSLFWFHLIMHNQVDLYPHTLLWQSHLVSLCETIHLCLLSCLVRNWKCPCERLAEHHFAVTDRARRVIVWLNKIIKYQHLWYFTSIWPLFHPCFLNSESSLDVQQCAQWDLEWPLFCWRSSLKVTEMSCQSEADKEHSEVMSLLFWLLSCSVRFRSILSFEFIQMITELIRLSELADVFVLSVHRSINQALFISAWELLFLSCSRLALFCSCCCLSENRWWSSEYAD